MRSIQFQFESVDIKLTLYSNTLLVVVSELGKFGSLIVGECEVMNGEMNIYEIKTQFGNREYLHYELFARSIMQEMYDSKKIITKLKEKLKMDQIPNLYEGKKLHLFISLKENLQRNKQIIQLITEKLIELF